MNPADLFHLGICPGAGDRDHHSGRHVFESDLALERPLRQTGIYRWWARSIGKGWLA